MKLSIIIPTYRRLSMVMELVDSLLPEKGLVNELIIVIDHNDEAGYKKTLEDKYASQFNLKVAEQPNGGRAATRNKGVNMSTGDVLLFFDDDMIVEKGTVKKHLDFHAQHPGEVLIGPAYRNPALANTDFFKFLVNMEKQWLEGEPVKQVSYANFNFTIANLSIPKNLFLSLGSLDSRLKLAVEDTELGIRAIKAGIKITHDRTVTSWHNDWPTIKGFIKRSNEYIESVRVLMVHHPEVAEVLPQLKYEKAGRLKKIALAGVRMLVCPFVFSENALFRTLPLNMKFKLYNLTIAANTSLNM